MNIKKKFILLLILLSSLFCLFIYIYVNIKHDNSNQNGYNKLTQQVIVDSNQKKYLQSLEKLWDKIDNLGVTTPAKSPNFQLKRDYSRNLNNLNELFKNNGVYDSFISLKLKQKKSKVQDKQLSNYDQAKATAVFSFIERALWIEVKNDLKKKHYKKSVMLIKKFTERLRYFLVIEYTNSYLNYNHISLCYLYYYHFQKNIIELFLANTTPVEWQKKLPMIFN